MRKTVLVLLVFVVVAVAIVAGAFYLKSHNNPFTASLPKSPAQKQAAVAASVNKEIKVTLATSNSYNVNQYINLAAEAKNPDAAYQYYLKAYYEMNKLYTQSKDPKIKLTMIRLASYLSTLPQFKESDIVIPK